MKSVAFLVSVFLAFVAGSAFADTTCSSSDGTSTYLESWYMGGPAPRPGMEVGRTEWRLSGQLIFRSVSCTPGGDLPPEKVLGCGRDGDSDIPFDDLVARFVPGSEVVLFQSPPSEPWQVLKKYAAKIEIFRPSGSALPNGLARVDDYVICTYRQIFAP